MNPIRGELGRENWDRHEPAPQPADFGVEGEHLSISDHVSSANLDCLPCAVGGTKSLGEIVEHGVDGDGLYASINPARANHHGHPLGQTADHFEGQTSRTHDYPGAKLGDAYAAFP
jgi:hypothetical protein